MTSEGLRITPRLIVGIGIFALGILWTLDNLNVLESDRLTDWWPLIIVAAGVTRLFEPTASRISSGIIILIGTMLLGDSLDVIEFDLGDLIPLAIAAVGAKLVWDAINRRDGSARLASTAGDITAVAVMAGVTRHVASESFRRADATAVMGGVEIDLREAKIAEGEQAVIDVFALWGGVEIKVPSDWKVDGRVFPLLGGFDDKSANKSANGPTLVIRGTAIMGGIDVKN